MDDAVRQYIRTKAAALLDGKDRDAVLAWADGHNQADIARMLGVHKGTITRILHGASEGARSKRTSAIGKLTAALAGDAEFARLHAAAEDEAARAAELGAADAFVTGWFRDIPRTRPDLVVPYAVMLVITCLAGTQGRVSLSTVREHFPTAAIEHSLRPLQVLGMLTFDGTEIRVKRTPVSRPGPSSFADPFVLTILNNLSAFVADDDKEQ